MIDAPFEALPGHSQDRIVVLFELRLCGRTIPAEVTLTSRDEMVFRMLIGREALQQGYGGRFGLISRR